MWNCSLLWILGRILEAPEEGKIKNYEVTTSTEAIILTPYRPLYFSYNFHNKEFKHDICSYSIGKLHFFVGIWRRTLTVETTLNCPTLLYARDQNATQIFKVVFLIPFKIYYLKIRVRIVTGLVLVYALTDFEPRY